MKKAVLFILLLSGYFNIYGQELPIYNHYFIYPNLYNPAYLSLSEYSEVTLLHRQQWVGIDGAPVVSNLGIQLPLSNKMSAGFNIANNESGLLTSTTAIGSFAYTLPVADRAFVSFGLGLGAGRQSIDVSQINDLSDPAVAGALDASFFLTGQAGVMLQYKRLNIGFSLPNLFENQVFSDEDFQEVGLDVLNTTTSSVRYNFELSPFLEFEPSVLFISSQNVDSQFKGAGTFYIKDIVWIGGIYGKETGATVFGGLNVNDFLKIGYSYDVNPPQVSGFSNGTHEFYLKFRFGKKKVNRSSSTEQIIAQNLPAEELVDQEEKLENEPDNTENKEEITTDQNKDTSAPKQKEKSATTRQAEDNNISSPFSIGTDVKQDNPDKNKTNKAENESPKNNTSDKTDKEEPSNRTENEKQNGTQKEEVDNDINEALPLFNKEEGEERTKRITEEETDKLEKEHRVVTVFKGDVNEELSEGYYVVVGAFKSEENAKNYKQQLTNANYSSQMGFNSETQLNYVYIAFSNFIEDIIGMKNEYRSKSEFQFEDTWILRIE